MVLQKLHQIFVDLSSEDHLHNVDRLLIRDAHPADKPALLADFFQHGTDLRPAAVHQHHIDAHELHQNDVAHHGVLQVVVYHRVPTIFDDHGLSRVFLDIRQCLHEHLCPLGGRYSHSRCLLHTGMHPVKNHAIPGFCLT